MSKSKIGYRVGKNGKLGVGCSATIFDQSREKILLIRRADNGKWAVPGGYMEPGESISEACKREVLEETNLIVEIDKLIGIYTFPNLLLEYQDGNKWQLIVLHFETKIIGGTLTLSDETSEVQYFTFKETGKLQMSQLDILRVKDSFSNSNQTIICDDFIAYEE